MSNSFDKLSVLDSLIEELNSYLPEIEANLGRLAHTPGDMEALEETYRRTHTIGGSASMMDFPGLAHVAHGMEDILGDVMDDMATLDSPTIGLLQRSLARMHRLVDGILDGINEDTVIAEDDADYSQYRVMLESAARNQDGRPPVDDNRVLGDAAASFSPNNAIAFLDEMIASFRTPSVAAGEEISWPEELGKATRGGLTSTSTKYPILQPSINPEVPAPAEPVQPSALEMLAATARHQPPQETPTGTPPAIKRNEGVAAGAQTVGEDEIIQPEAASAGLVPREDQRALVQVYSELQEESQVLEVHASSLKRSLTQLRLAVSVIEGQRTEFKSCLDGSKDALDRMEEWAGRAMGLNLRNSPEQVRRYLPLSVMWVANTKLKKVLELLTQMTGSMELTDEQVHTTVRQLHTTVATCGDVLEQIQSDPSAQLFTDDPGWTPWEMRAGAVRERVTFERRGDPTALRSEIEAKVREELRHEFENRPFTLAARAELERQIRTELLEEFEAKRQLQLRVSGSEQRESLNEIEARLRNEIEIEVRREFLNQLTGGIEESLAAANQSQSAPRSVASPPPPLPASSVASRQSNMAMPSLVSDLGEEANEIFRMEAEEHLQTISMHVAALENNSTDHDPIQGIRRATHTLKGAAGMMGFRTIAELCHISEDLLDSVMEGAIIVSPAVLSLILDTAETLDALINRKGSGEEYAAMIQALRIRYIGLLGEQTSLPHAVEEEIEADIEENSAAIMENAAVTSVVADNQSTEAGQQVVRTDLSVRVPLLKLDELVNLFGELLVNRSVLEERLERLTRLVSDADVSSARLRDVGQKLESRFEAAMLPSGRSVQVMPGQGDQSKGYSRGGNGKNSNNRAEPLHLAEFDELELDRYTEFHQLARGLSEGISDMTTLSSEMDAIIRDCEAVFGRETRLSTTFQDRLMKARLVPLSTMIPRLYRAARAVALKQHKEFEFVLEGQETEVDRTVIEEIAGPLLHLMRNAVNHAIETPEVRLRQGKPPAGQIRLSAAYEGNQVVITVRDDGTGIDPERVRNAAIERNLIRPDHVLHDSDIIELIFRPGFSTAEVLSEESGRGVGLDVVRDSVSRLRGTLEVESMPGQRTAFTMKSPTSLAIQNATLVLVGGQQFAIPTVMVEAIGRVDNFKRTTFAGRPAVLVRNDMYTLTMLSQILSLSVSNLDDKAQLLFINAGGHRVALDEVEIRARSNRLLKI